MQSSPTILIAALCGFFLILGGMLAVFFFATQKANARDARIAEALGLKLIADTERVLQKVAYVNGIEHPEIYTLFDVFHHHHAHVGDVYFFSLYRRGTKSGGALEKSVLAFVSPLWKLPKLLALPRLNGGNLADIGNNLTEKAIDIKHEVIKAPHIPRFDENYFLGELEPVSQIRPPDGFLRTLASNPNLLMHMGGDTFTISYRNDSVHLPDEEQMKQLYRIGMQLARELQD